MQPGVCLVSVDMLRSSKSYLFRTVLQLLLPPPPPPRSHRPADSPPPPPPPTSPYLLKLAQSAQSFLSSPTPTSPRAQDQLFARMTATVENPAERKKKTEKEKNGNHPSFSHPPVFRCSSQSPPPTIPNSLLNSLLTSQLTSQNRPDQTRPYNLMHT